MDDTNWLKQTKDKPLFADLLWSRPENRAHAGKLLIIGGNLHGFSAPANAYQHAAKAGIGTARVMLPDTLKRTIGKMFEFGEFVPSTPSGSMSKKALAELIAAAAWADGVLLAGDFGRNSETGALVELFLHHYDGQVTIAQDAVQFITSSPSPPAKRTTTCLVLTIAELQRLFTALRLPEAIKLEMPEAKLVKILQEFTSDYPLALVVKQPGSIHAAYGGQVSTTVSDSDLESPWRVQTAATTSVWWLQNPSKTFEALATGVFETIVKQ